MCRTVAYQRGFVWVMVLLARERDAVHSYNDLKRYWDSYDDLTGDKILFIMSIANRREESYSAYPAHEIEGWRRLYNPNLLIMNQSVPTIPRWEFPSEKIIQKYRNIAVENNTYFISELCYKFNISEKDVPSIVLFCAEPYKESNPIVIPIQSDDLYVSIKDFITVIQPELENFGNIRAELSKIISDSDEIKRNIQQNVISSAERRYITAKTKLLYMIETGSAKCDTFMLQEAIEKKDIHACKLFPQPIRGYLNQIIDLQEQYKEIESCITEKYSCEQQLYAKRITLEKEHTKKCDMLKKARYDLDFTIKKYVTKLQKVSIKGGRYMKNRVPHFKIGITFSGRYREQFVEPFCDELLNLGYTRNDIFYDSWHDVLINGVHGDRVLKQIYLENCDCVVVLLSPDYKEKNWTGHIEWSAVKELINTGDDDKICLLRVGSADIGEIDGLYKNQTIAKTIDDMSAPEIAAFIDCKYKMLVSCESENIESTVNDSIYDQLRISDIMFADDESVHDGLKIKAGVYKGVSKPLIIDANGRARVVDTYSPCLQAVIFSKFNVEKLMLIFRNDVSENWIHNDAAPVLIQQVQKHEVKNYTCLIQAKGCKPNSFLYLIIEREDGEKGIWCIDIEKKGKTVKYKSVLELGTLSSYEKLGERFKIHKNTIFDEVKEVIQYYDNVRYAKTN